jgi:CHAT domain-containing protein/tetratricopeptide (TPR) repeat protein
LTAQGRFPDALRAYELMRHVAERIGDRAGMASALLGIGTIHGRQGNYREAAAALHESLAIEEDLHDEVGAESALNNLGIVSRLQGEYEKAIDYYNRALALAERMSSSRAVAFVLNNIGGVHLMRGNYRDALHYYQESLAIKEKNQTGEVSLDISSTLNNISTVYERIGDFDLALEYLQRSEDVYRRLGKPVASEILVDLGRLSADRRQYDLAVAYYERALAAYEAAGTQAQMASTLTYLGSVRRALGDIDGAMKDFQRSLAISERINDRYQVADTLIEMSGASLMQRDPSTALESVKRAVRLARQTALREILWRALVAEGEVHDGFGDKNAAEKSYSEAVDLIEELRSEAAGGSQERQEFFEGRLAAFENLTGLLAAEHREAEALAMAERAKARVMLEVLRDGRADFTLLTPDERERQRQLERNLTVAHARVEAARAKQPPNENTLGSLRESWLQARAAEAEFRTILYEKYPALRLSRGDATPGSLQDAEAIVRDTATALIEFTVTPHTTYLFVVTRDAARVASLATFKITIEEEELRKQAAQLRQQLASRDFDFEQTARHLYQQLFGSAQARLNGKTHLIIVPDGPLWEIPFQALEPRSKHYLIEDAAVSIAPSIAVLRETRAKREQVARSEVPRLVAVGDPTSANLPEAAGQVQRLKELYGPGRSEILTGGAASEERFISLAGNANVLHVATHGVLDDKSPMYSFLSMARHSDSDAARDGRLEGWEIMKLNLHADVVVLAGCETGRGRIGAGEGVIGLAWAFFLAGSPRTVVSLWNVEAESTTDLMVAFHKQLRVGLTKTPEHPAVAESLRGASLSLLRDSRFRHPFYWAAFSVIGDGS